jgi:alcohol dehydrogenase
VSQLELDDPGPGEVLVEVAAAGVCHSDLSVVDGNRARPVPMLLGHEASGRVLALGPGVDDLAVGQHVVMTFLPRCGQCAGCATEGRTPCVRGSASNAAGELLGGGRRLTRDGLPVHHHLGVSAFATHAVVDTRSVVRVEDDVPPDVAAVLGCAVLTGGGALLNAAPPEPGQSVMVVGLGGVGMAALLTAVALGHGDVVAVDGVATKRDQARELGATSVMDPAELASGGVRCDVVVEAAGNVRAFEAALAATAPGGRTVTVGLPAPDAFASVSPLALVAEARTVIGSYLGSAVPARDIPVFAQWWREGRLPVEALVSSRIALDDVNRAMDELAAGTAVRQVIEL